MMSFISPTKIKLVMSLLKRDRSQTVVVAKGERTRTVAIKKRGGDVPLLVLVPSPSKRERILKPSPSKRERRGSAIQVAINC